MSIRPSALVSSSAAALAAVLAFTLLAGGCVSEDKAARPARLECPWPEAGAPLELCRLADDLESFTLLAGRLPDTLAQLDQSGIGGDRQWSKRAFAYHPAGIGGLRDGWKVQLADDRRRDAKGVWCLLKAPVRVSGQANLRVALVSLAELQESARRAGEGR